MYLNRMSYFFCFDAFSQVNLHIYNALISPTTLLRSIKFLKPFFFFKETEHTIPG